MQSATKVGIFFIIGMVILGLLTFRIENFGKLTKKHYKFITYFSSANGLEPGSKVALAGVKIGEVEDVSIVDHKVRVVMSIQKGTPLRKDSKATISTDFLLGNSYIDISLASSDSPALEPGSIIAGIDRASFGDMLANINSVITGVQNILRPFEGGKEAFDSLANLGKSLEQIGSKINNLLDSSLDVANGLKSGKGTLGRLITDESLYNKMENALDGFGKLEAIFIDNEENIRKALAGFGESGENIKEAMEGLNKAFKGVGVGEGTLAKLINDPSLYNNFNDAMASARVVFGKIERGEGTLSKLLTDDKLYNEITKIISDVKETIKGYKEQIPVGAFGSVVFGAF